MEKLTSLAALRAGDTDKVQKLEQELERAAAQRRSTEEKERKYRDAVEQVLALVGHMPLGRAGSMCGDSGRAHVQR